MFFKFYNSRMNLTLKRLSTPVIPIEQYNNFISTNSHLQTIQSCKNRIRHTLKICSHTPRDKTHTTGRYRKRYWRNWSWNDKNYTNN